MAHRYDEAECDGLDPHWEEDRGGCGGRVQRKKVYKRRWPQRGRFDMSSFIRTADFKEHRTALDAWLLIGFGNTNVHHDSPGPGDIMHQVTPVAVKKSNYFPTFILKAPPRFLWASSKTDMLTFQETCHLVTTSHQTRGQVWSII